MKSVKNRSHKIKMLYSVAIGDAISIVVCFFAAMACPVFVINGTIEGISVMMLANTTLCIAVFVGVLIAGLVTKEKKLLTVLLCAGSFLVFLLSCALLFFEINGTAIIGGLLSSVFGTACALLIVFRQKKRLKNKRIKRYSR